MRRLILLAVVLVIALPALVPGIAEAGAGTSPFVRGLLGGLLGAGIGGLLIGHGFFGGIHGLGGLFGLLVQIFLLVTLGRWLLRTLFGTPAYVSGPGRMPEPPAPPAPHSAASGRPVEIGPGDYQTFEHMLLAVQAAWSAHDVPALRTLATPEMVSYFSEQLAEQTSRGVHNTVSDVRLDHGDLAESWAEDGREYASVAMRFSMTDVTRDAAGQIVDGSPDEHFTATEIWTFLRVPGGRWVVSAIQQAR